MIKNLFSILFLFTITLLPAQECDLKFDNLTTKNGLSASWVRTIYEDNFGFMWFGTSDGLNRYDAYTTKIYHPDEDDEYSLINGAINHLHGLSEDKLLVCTEQGVNVFTFENERFHPFPFLNNVRVTYALTDKSNIWFTSYSGLFCFNSVDSSMTNFKHDPLNSASISHNQLTMCYLDKSDNLWIATFNGLDRYNKNTNTFYHYLQNENQPTNNRVNAIVEDNRGRLWVGVANKGLYVFNRNHDSSTEGEFIHVLDGSVTSLLIDDKNILWIGNELGLGIKRIRLNDFSLDIRLNAESCIGKPGKHLSLSDNTISSIYQDRSGGIWIGTFAGGVNYHSHLMKQFHEVHRMPGDRNSLSDNLINCFVDEKDYLWVGTERGLSRLDKSTNEFTNFFHEPGNQKSLGANGVLCMKKDSRGNLWVGTWAGGLNLYNPSSADFTRYFTDKTKDGTLASNNVFAILEDSKGNLWIGTDGGGLNLYNYNSGKFSVFMPDEDNPASLFHNAVNDICETSDGKLFISVYHSLELYDYETETFSHFTHIKGDSNSIGPGIIIDIFEDSKNNLWVATSAGLNFFDQEKGTFSRYTYKHGLPGNTVQSIIEDNNSNLWLGTNNGITKFVHGIQLPDKPEFITYTSKDGLMGNEFTRRSVMKNTEGMLYFGGFDAYVYFHPDSIFENPLQSEVVLTDFRLIGGSEKSNTKGSFLTKEINHVEKIVLNYDQSDFIIYYSVLNYLNPQKNSYKYILEGYEKEWHQAGNDRTATYTNINPGKYMFRVMGANNDGVWSAKDKRVQIVIKPAWWGTLWFRVVAGLILLALVYVFIRKRFRIFSKQKDLLEKMVRERTTELSELNAVLEEKQEEISIQNEELTKHRTNLQKLVDDRTEAMKKALKRAEEADRLKSAFLANMSHEIRTPMNAIVGFATLLTNDDLTENERDEYLGIINNNSETLMVLINDILEISLIEANQLRLNRSTFNVTDILEELESYYQLRNRKELEMVFVNKNDETDLYLHSDKTRLRQIFTNLLNNAYKYTDSGKISFGYKIQDKEVKFFVSDTGIGIAEKEYDNIFNYFHKIDKGENKLYRGAGIGLSISNKLVELMGGKIWLDSSIGKGTSFYFTLPPDESTDNNKDDLFNEAEKQNNLQDVTVVVAEDETNNYKLIEKILKPTKANIIWAENGKQAVEKVSKLTDTNNCVVLMDIKMPLLNGINAAKIIKATHPQLPIIAVTAYAQANDKDQILKQDFIDYIAKPLKPEQLLLKIFKYAYMNQ